VSRGKFISLEGIDGAGKSTHIAGIAERLRAVGKEVVVTREPGGTPLGEKLRELLLSRSMHVETETLLMFAARREHIAQIIAPALDAGRWVLSDRFTDATYAYQGAGRGLARGKVTALERWVQDRLRPDLTIVFDVPVDLAARRLGGNRADRFEGEDRAFFERVRAEYLARAEAEPRRVRIVNGAQPLDEVNKHVENIISSIC
jgi:dTMP kinase